MSDKITIEREHLKQVFDLVTGSMDYGSGFLDTDDIVLLRKIAVVLGVDPMECTPDEYRAKFPHVFSERLCGWRCRDQAAAHVTEAEYAVLLRQLAEVDPS